MKEGRGNVQDTRQAAKIGVYVCHCGGNISDHVDVEAVCGRAAELPGVAVARHHMFMCSDPGQELIIKDVQSGAVNRVVVASCSPGLHESTFRRALARAGMNPYLYEHANIREQVSWVHHGRPATEKAVRLVSAAVAKAGRLQPLDHIRVEARPHATVIGGGVAGLRAAVDLAGRGIRVALVEKTPFLGGNLARLDRVAPAGEKASDLIAALAEKAVQNPAIRVHTCTIVKGFEGHVGDFRLVLEKAPLQKPASPSGFTQADLERIEAGTYIPFAGLYPAPVPEERAGFDIRTGVIIMATGFQAYTPGNGEYGYRAFKEVVTLADLHRLMAPASKPGDRLVIHNREIRSVVLIHCVGSREIPGIHPEREDHPLNEYCSRTCCTALLDAACTIRRRHPGTRVYELYRDIRTYGRGQEELYEAAARSGVVFARFEDDDPPAVSPAGEASGFPLQVRVRDILTFGEELCVPADLVVLATAMEPSDISEMAGLMKLSRGADRFLLEVHPKLRPVELPKAGILLAGTCQAPMDSGEACSSASAAAAKGASLLGRGHVALDPFVAVVDAEKCSGCGACVEACLVDGALQVSETDAAGRRGMRPEVVPALCAGCGACTAVCPEGAIQVNGYTLEQYETMVDCIASGHAAA